MGRQKELLIEAEETGWMPRHDERYVCTSCIEDEALGEVVRAHAESNNCSYCDSTSDDPIAAPLDSVTEHMSNCIGQEYTDPAEEMPYDSEEGRYFGKVYETWELLEVIGFQVSNDRLREDVYSSFVRDFWGERDWDRLDPTRLWWHGWKSFKEAVKHKRRYTFWSMSDEHEESWHPDYMPVGKTLDMIGEAIRQGKITTHILPDTQIWRVRVHDASEELANASDFATPKRDKATQSNRMSPAGVPMFYGAIDFDTAVAETVDSKRIEEKVVTGGSFAAIRELTLLDLADLPPVPSFFDLERSDVRPILAFLHGFAHDISQPIERNGREHIEYVPTQVLTEYIRWEFKDEHGHSLDGIRYRSSKNNNACFVLFCENEECLEPTAPWNAEQRMRFDSQSLRSMELGASKL